MGLFERLFPTSASTFSGDIDGLVWLITILVGFWFLLAEAMFFWLIFRFRAREGVPGQYITGKEKHLKKWINIPHWLIIGCDVVIIVAAVMVWVRIKQAIPPADAVVRVTGQQWAWTFRDPGADGKLDTDDDIVTADEMHVQVNKVYHFQLESKDVLHSFSVPVFRLKQDVVPGRTITGWFKATKTGVHDIQCAEMCGIGHGAMMAQIHIESPEQHASWVAAHTTALATAAGGAASAAGGVPVVAAPAH
jgi:cytochrome c oxidase subunit 2